MGGRWPRGPAAVAFILATKAGWDTGVPLGEGVGDVVGRGQQQCLEHLALAQLLARRHRHRRLVVGDVVAELGGVVGRDGDERAGRSGSQGMVVQDDESRGHLGQATRWGSASPGPTGRRSRGRVRTPPPDLCPATAAGQPLRGPTATSVRPSRTCGAAIGRVARTAATMPAAASDHHNQPGHQPPAPASETVDAVVSLRVVGSRWCRLDAAVGVGAAGRQIGLAQRASNSSGVMSTARAFDPSEGPTIPRRSMRSMSRPARANPTAQLALKHRRGPQLRADHEIHGLLEQVVVVIAVVTAATGAVRADHRVDAGHHLHGPLSPPVGHHGLDLVRAHPRPLQALGDRRRGREQEHVALDR